MVYISTFQNGTNPTHSNEKILRFASWYVGIHVDLGAQHCWEYSKVIEVGVLIFNLKKLNKFKIPRLFLILPVDI